jgi:hypothetical protein
MLAALQNDTHLSCCDHMLNTVLTHLFDKKNLDSLPELSALITASKDLVRYFKKSSLMPLLKKSLKQEVPTRWCSMHAMLQSILDSFDEVEHILTTKSQRFRYANLLLFMKYFITIAICKL